MKEILGKKLGMTRVFTPSGDAIGVTVIEAGPCPVVDIKTIDKNGYDAYQVGFGQRRKALFSKPKAGQFANAGVEPTRYLREIRFDDANKTHGQSDRWRAPGSIGQSSYPSRVFKGMKMAGRMGKDKVTTLNLQVVKVIPEENLILVKGAVPGFKGSLVKVRSTNRG
jgi:large subunit ribosomal protein L3